MPFNIFSLLINIENRIIVLVILFIEIRLIKSLKYWQFLKPEKIVLTLIRLIIFTHIIFLKNK
ncbi:hypothetical protein BpHYR1_045834 [Brachionus plicatilis]|uniref:Uncharacterized protein n=1 Tax=Brachionus plicatilis TaxID=10195 RepID=A0A3M7RQM9_BRAPC|nr:hypothetical protein BpHYR1_045834 [Brachionus plicatilis]